MNENHEQTSLLPSDKLDRLKEESSASQEEDSHIPFGNQEKKHFRPYDQIRCCYSLLH